MKNDVRTFVSKFVDEVRSNNAAVFLGAGASVPAGFVNWSELLKPVAEELELDIGLERDFVALAQFHVNESGHNRTTISQTILDAISVDARPTENHRILASLPIPVFWTTNYDKLMEVALQEAGKTADIKHTVKQLAITRPRRDAVVYKMHGDVDHVQDVTITKDDYERYFRKNGAFINALSGDLVAKTFVFIGFSFTDPNLDYILSRIRVNFEDHQRRHFAFFKTRTRLDNESEAEFQHAMVRQRLMIGDLKRFNITAILVDDYEEITEALREVARRHRMNTIFVSSSASDFQPWGEGAVTGFMRKLGELLVDNSYRIATGLGLGVGNALFTGALEKIYRSPGRQFDDHLLIRPFPQFVENLEERERLWESYRNDFIPTSGLALFLFGNKLLDGRVVEANGMVSEFEIAVRQGLIVLPIGATGSTAQMLAQRLLADPSAYPTVSAAMLPVIQKLAEPVDDLNQLFQPLQDLLQLTR